MDKKQIIIISILSVVLIAIVTLTVIIIAREPKTVIEEFEAPAFDEAAILGTPDVDESLNYREMEVAEGFKFSMCGNLTLKNGGCPVYFTSAADNDIWLLMKIYDNDGNLLGKSGILRPGEYLESIKIEKNITSTTPITVKILSYEPGTYISRGSAKAELTLAVEN
jgi:hypothetical protein